mgnify:CR=1 FL=1
MNDIEYLLSRDETARLRRRALAIASGSSFVNYLILPYLNDFVGSISGIPPLDDNWMYREILTALNFFALFSLGLNKNGRDMIMADRGSKLLGIEKEFS